MLDFATRRCLSFRLRARPRSFGAAPVGQVDSSRLRSAPVPHDRALELASALAVDHRSQARPHRASPRERGFALVLFLTILPVVLAAMFALMAASTLIHERRTAMNACRRELMAGLERAAVPMRALLSTNPRARWLRIRELELTAAILADPEPASRNALILKRAAIHRQQSALYARQRRLYSEAARSLAKTQGLARAALMRARTWIRISGLAPVIARPAIRPTRPGVAPEWETEKPFPDRQTLEQKWHWSFTIRGPAGKFLTGSHRQEETCAATIDDRRNDWIASVR